MDLAHFEPLSLVDFPGSLAATVFTVGCNFRCPYCHNPELVILGDDTPRLECSVFLDFLLHRTGKLDGVCITGGEPTLQKDLPAFIRQIHELGYKVKLDTNGSNPDMLTRLLDDGLLDYVAMDVKAPSARYQEIVHNPAALAAVTLSIGILGTHQVRHEFRTTIVPSLLEETDIVTIGSMLPDGSSYVIQNFVPTKAIDAHLLSIHGFSSSELARLVEVVAKRYPLLRVSARGGT